jgi:hypothetical protein
MIYECIKPLKKEDLEHLHTKQLLDKLNEQRYSSYDCEFCPNTSRCYKIARENRNILKAILKTRPHVMSKKESKEYRKAKIKKGV